MRNGRKLGGREKLMLQLTSFIMALRGTHTYVIKISYTEYWRFWTSYFTASSPLKWEEDVASPAVDRWCCGGYWVRLFSSQSRAAPPYSVVYRVHVCSALDASLKASLKDPLWKVNSITASWQEEEGPTEETVGMAMLLLSDAALHPANTPPSQTRAPPRFRSPSIKSAIPLRLFGVTEKWWAFELVRVCEVNQFASFFFFFFFLNDSGPVPVLVMSLLFIASVFMLHIWGKYTRS